MSSPLPPSSQPGERDAPPYPVLTKLLTERHRDGRTATLERWRADAQRKLDGYIAKHSHARQQRDAQRILDAYALAAELVEHLEAISVKRPRNADSDPGASQ